VRTPNCADPPRSPRSSLRRGAGYLLPLIVLALQTANLVLSDDQTAYAEAVAKWWDAEP